jgi:hypothetical protein
MHNITDYYKKGSKASEGVSTNHKWSIKLNAKDKEALISAKDSVISSNMVKGSSLAQDKRKDTYTTESNKSSYPRSSLKGRSMDATDLEELAPKAEVVIL